VQDMETIPAVGFRGRRIQIC